MQGNQKIIDMLNERLADELTAINQYMVHAEMYDNWGYQRLHAAVEKIAIDEMRHAEKLIARILFLEGRPVVTKLNPIHIGEEVPKMLDHDHATELGAINAYNAAIQLCHQVGDGGTRELLQGILEQEEGHIDFEESQLAEIKQMGLNNYLPTQNKK
jgi:bacterioferritin